MEATAPSTSISSSREQRLQAVAKLKRAASLPRMKDGRRPPMHPEGFSEGERASPAGSLDAPTPPSEAEPVAAPEPPPPPEPEPEPELAVEPEQVIEIPVEIVNEVEIDADNEVDDPVLTPTTKRKRRSRSRSRSRGSKDFKGKMRAAQTPTPSSVNPGDSSQDEAPVHLPPLFIPPNFPHPLLSPSPSARLLRSPTPDAGMFPYPSSPPTPLPSLEAISKNIGLFRSNSAGRMLAMAKLTGGTETYEPSPSPTPPTTKFRRNNTVSGGERNAARKHMLDKLAGRSTPAPKESEWEQSGPEETFSPAPTPSPTPKRRRRRSRRTSASATNPMTTDSEMPSTSPNTPIVPPTPLPITADPAVELRARSVTPSHITIPIHSISPEPPKNNITSHPATPDSGLQRESDRRRRRSVVVEEDEDYQPRHEFPMPPSAQPYSQRVPYSNDPTMMSTHSGSSNVPVYMNSRTPEHEEDFPSSPFATPIKEKVSQDDIEEEVLYPESSSGYIDDRELSWVAAPVPEIRMPINEDGDGAEDEYDASSPRSSNDFSPRDGYENVSPRDSSDSQNMIVELETSPDLVPPSPSSVAALSHTASFTRGSDDSQSFPTRASATSRSPLNAEFTDIEDRDRDRSPGGNESSSKRTNDTASWGERMGERVRNAFGGGRRSRTNSLRRDHTDSSVSRESGASINKAENGNGGSTFTIQQSQPPLSASASYVSLGSPNNGTAPGSRAGGVSPGPFPAPSSADLTKYQNLNEKLFPFPGMLEELRRKGIMTASTPDVSVLAAEMPSHNNNGDGINGASSSSDRLLGHQMSDAALRERYGLTSPPLSGSTSSTARTDYFTISPPPSNGSSKLPTTLGGVRQWLGRNKNLFSPASPSASGTSTPSHDGKPPKKPSLSDLLRLKKENDSATEADELGSALSGSTVLGGKQISAPIALKDHPSKESGSIPASDTERTPKGKRTIPMPLTTSPPPAQAFGGREFDSMPSPPDPSSTTPDPQSSMSEHRESAASSTTTMSSQYSFIEPMVGSQGSIVLERLDENLRRASKSPLWASAVDDTPRKLLIASPVLQVVNANTVKDRFLFLFTDILVIAKPVTVVFDNEEDTLTRGQLQDNRKFIVKSIVLLKNLKCGGDRADPQTLRFSGLGTPPRSPLIRSFVHQFSKDPDHAISTLFSKSGVSDDPVLLGKLLFRTMDLDCAQLGDYLSRRTSKLVLRSYLSSFGFAGLRVDRALRAFLLSIHIPAVTASSGAFDYLLDAFATRWYEANAAIVTYDRNVTIRLVRLLVQLNSKLHGGISSDASPGSYARRDMRREFIDFFRTCDPRYTVPDDVLEDLYLSISLERLCQAREKAHQELTIAVKRPLPTRLTYKVQSEPVVLRIPQPDPLLSIQLYGQDLIFEPPVLTFQKSTEASFRVTGTSLGTKTMMMCRSGPKALYYSGLPLSNAISVERAFMRNTFQVAFTNREGIRRRYMFSVDDPLIRNEWAASLTRQIEASVSQATSPGSSKFFRAANAMAFSALQEILMGPSDTSISLDRALRGLNGSMQGNGSSRPSPAFHVRSKSRSQVYHRSGAARNELDLSNGQSPNNSGSSEGVDFPSPRSDTPQWTRRQLELQCLQNSSISLVLSLLQIGAPQHGRDPSP